MMVWQKRVVVALSGGLFFLSNMPLHAGDVTVVQAKAHFEPQSGDGQARFFTLSVTLQHKDQGWKHYANRWEVWTPDGLHKLGERKLAHPHVKEQPFTRSLDGVKIPKRYAEVLIKAGDTVHGTSPHTRLLTLPVQ
ncbi:hypothetical protein [Magnetococcus sp. PR-3]|uniref:hypothetical protein n=1 Tax=Magnetococcus sp. PR-3 TaxID=3120355 RepID=UPI002FCE5C50